MHYYDLHVNQLTRLVLQYTNFYNDLKQIGQDVLVCTAVGGVLIRKVKNGNKTSKIVTFNLTKDKEF